MTDTERQQRLQQFFSGYFHEDWDVEVDDWTGVLDALAMHAAPSHIAQLADDIVWLASRSDVEDSLFDQLGCYYDPQADGLTVCEWLSSLADRLRGDPRRDPGGDPTEGRPRGRSDRG